jgi:hypothetical protein
MDIDGQGLELDELAVLDRAVDRFREQEGLLDDYKVHDGGWPVACKAPTQRQR